jgi:hypothetical protein
MVNIRITFPVLTQSLTKSIDQRSFGRVAAGLVTTPFQRIRRRIQIISRHSHALQARLGERGSI